ncbi:hypothetical protein L1D14_04415 [Vibrio tubiashii]|uniref:hypothetical protein n=1 Tax=Vibrio tubiashii TaxID=29498 RepID=UPI001EFE063C|nr:hypothetical protein [Vibrio tubiashii]MCG9575476.1 hypothetical protein [Vibrio tubiashii]
MRNLIPSILLEAVRAALPNFGAGTVEIGNYSIQVEASQFFQDSNPRQDENLSMMAFSHRRYTLGDTGVTETLESVLDDVLQRYDVDASEYDGCGYSLDERVQNKMRLLPAEHINHVLIMPVYMYDHSGITISLSPFSCSFDSSIIGWVFTTPEHLNGFGHTFKDFSCQSDREKVAQWIESDIKTYDAYLKGDVYEFTILDRNGYVVDSYGHFFGDHTTSGLMECVHENLSHHVKQAQQAQRVAITKHAARLKALIRNRVPLSQRMFPMQCIKQAAQLA